MSRMAAIARVVNENDFKKLFSKLEEQIGRAEDYLEKSIALEKRQVEGAGKLSKKIKAELKFLHELKNGAIQLKQCHLNSSNLSHLGAIVNVTVDCVVDTVAVLKTVVWSNVDNGDCLTIIVDIVTPTSWLKVTARNPVALHKTYQGEGNFGDKSIVKQAKEYIEASAQHKVNFTSPNVVFVFTQGITETLAESLLSLGVSVKGDIQPDPGTDCLRNPGLSLHGALPLDKHSPFECVKVNLDVTAMIALVSDLTNGFSHYTFVEQVLSDQAKSERQNPLLPDLNKFLEGKELYACSLAISSFHKILDTLGGVREKRRARELLGKVKKVSDCPSERSQNLTTSGSVKARPKIVFGTGETLKAVTVSSNASFVRAAKQQGAEFSVFIHEPRALTESKEPFATSLKNEELTL